MILRLELIKIDIEIKKHNRIKEFFRKLHSKFEDMMFFIIQKTPEKLIPHWLMEWLNLYLIKRLNELKQQTIKQTWQKMYFENAVDEISIRQQHSEQ